MSADADQEVMDSVIGRCINEWSVADGGMHFSLDDGRIVIVEGSFSVSILTPEEIAVH